MATQPRSCVYCSGPICAENRSGYCHLCKSEGMKRALFADPARKAALVARIAAVSRSPRLKESKRQRWLEGRFWEKGQASQPKGGKARQRMAASLSETKMAWCPPHLREQYRFLMRSKKMKMADARRIILEEHEVEMRRWRRSIGVVEPVTIETQARRGLLFIDRASTAAAKWAGVDEIWVRSREPRLKLARWAVFLALRRGGWSFNRIAVETGMNRKSVKYALARAEVLVGVPGSFSEVYALVIAA